MKSSRVFLFLMSILLVFSLAACSSEPVASVGKEKISSVEYKFFLGLVKMDMETSNGITDESTDAQKKEFWDGSEDGQSRVTVAKNKAIDKLHELKILLMHAKSERYKLEESDLSIIDSAIESLIQEEGNGNRKDADKVVKEKFGISLNDYEKIYKDYYLAYNKYAPDLVKSITIKEEDIKARYEKNEPTYNTEKRTVKHVLIKTIDDSFNPLEEDILKEKEKLANDILSRAKAGEDFDALVQQYTEDTASKPNNGQYSFAKGEFVEEFENYSFKEGLKEGDIDMVKSELGYHIIKFIKNGTTYEAEKDNIRAELQAEAIKAKLDNWKSQKEYTLTKDQEAIDKVEF
ncbi:MAG TPA: peptidylprolyl isomerase [Pseudobacteroides sp.]|nr:peptidylprolyl isomerase [Pseudobacteroides sp.]